MANGNGEKRWSVPAQVVVTILMAAVSAFVGMKVGLAKSETAQAALDKRVDGIESRLEKRFDRIESMLYDVLLENGNAKSAKRVMP